MKEKIEELLNNCHEERKMIIKQLKEMGMCAIDVSSAECFFLSKENTLKMQLYEQKISDLEWFIKSLQSILDEDKKVLYLLTIDEREFLKKIFKTAEINVATIVKLPVVNSLGTREYLSVSYEIGIDKTRTWNLPSVEKGTKYKGLELFRAYTKEELKL